MNVFTQHCRDFNFKFNAESECRFKMTMFKQLNSTYYSLICLVIFPLFLEINHLIAILVQKKRKIKKEITNIAYKTSTINILPNHLTVYI